MPIFLVAVGIVLMFGWPLFVLFFWVLTGNTELVATLGNSAGPSMGYARAAVGGFVLFLVGIVWELLRD